MTLLASLVVGLMLGSAAASAQVRSGSERAGTSASAPGAPEAQAPVARLSVGETAERSIVVEIELPALPPGLGTAGPAIATEGMQRSTLAGINLPAFTRELGLAAGRLEILSVESTEQAVAGIVRTSLADAPLTGDSARDRLFASRLPPPPQGDVYPAEWATVELAGRLNGLPVSVLSIHPYRYDAARGIVLAARRIRLRIETTEPIAPAATASLASAFADRTRKAATGTMMSAASTATTAPDGFEYKVFVDRDGVYRLYPDELRSAGLPIDAIDTRSLKLFADGIEQPLLVVDRGNQRLEQDEFGREYIEFFGERRRARGAEAGSDLYFDPYARTSVYFLSWGGELGKRIVEESGVVQSERIDPSGDLTGRGASFLSTIHLEEDQVSVLLANAELNTPSDRFDRRMWGVVPPNEIKRFPVLLPHPNVLSQRPVELRAAIRSSLRNSEQLATVGAVHGVELFVDGFRAITAEVPAAGLSILNSTDHMAEPLPPGKLRIDGTNEIALANRRSSAQAELTDAYLNWVELTYPRLYVADGDSIEFSAPPQFGARYATFRLRGFGSPSIRVYRRGISRVTNVSVIAVPQMALADTTYDVQFQVYVASAGERFFATTEENILHPVLLRDAPSDLVAASNAADFLVIVDDVNSDLGSIDDDRNPLRRLLEFKRASGFTPKLVRATDIYDEFNGGVVSPLAIKRFLSHAWHSWSMPPRYALILAAGRPVPAARLASLPPAQRELVGERSYVPTIMMQTVLYGATECDYLLGCIDGEAPFRTNLLEGVRTSVTDDLIAEVIVGRVPVGSSQDIASYVDKLIEQQTRPDRGEWRGRSLLIGGWEEVQGYQLMQITNDYLRNTSEPARFIAAESFDTSRYRYGNDRSILGILSSGVGLVTYLGHGGGGQWEESAELNLANAGSLANRGRMGAVLSMTCFTGAYDVQGGLIGRLLVSPAGGAIQAFGTPGFGWLRNNGLLTDAIIAVMHNPRYRGLSFGEILTLGKALYVGTYLRTFPDHVPTVASMYAVFGDPSIVVPYALDTIGLVATTATAAPGGRLSASARLPFIPTTLVAHLFDTTEMRIADVAVDVQRSGDIATVSASVPAGYGLPYVGLRLYASDDVGRSLTGAVRVPTNGASVSVVRPASPLVAGSDAVFEIEHYAAAPLDSVRMTLRYDTAPVFSDVGVALTRVAPSLYRSAPIAAAMIEPGATIDVTLPVGTTAGALTRTFVVEGGADPAAFAENASDSARRRYGPRARFVMGQAINAAIAMGATPAGARLLATAYNWGDRDAVGVPWRIELDSAGATTTLGTGTVSIPARGSAAIDLDVGARPPLVGTVRLVLDPRAGDHWADAFRENNSAFHTTPLSAAMIRSGVGLTIDGVSAAPYAVASIFSMTMAPEAARGDGIVVAILDSAAPRSQQRWTLLPIGTATTSGPVLRLITHGVDPATPVELSLAVAGVSTPPQDARIVRYDSTTRLWIVAPTRAAGTNMLVATVPAGGIYAVARVDDNVGPRIRFSVEGQFFLDSSAVPADARFSAVIFDESGIDPARLSATLDGVALEPGRDVVWLDSTITAAGGSVRVQKPVGVGTHTLCVTAADRAGNVGSECTTFEVDGELALRLYGNFPNPFAAETFVAYEIRGASVVDGVELKIFSTAGRLVRTFRFPSAQVGETSGLLTGGTGDPTSIGYHEAWWDGRDDQGREVANGVYFYRLRVSTPERQIEELGTMARIR